MKIVHVPGECVLPQGETNEPPASAGQHPANLVRRSRLVPRQQRLQKQSRRPQNAHQDEDPQENAIDDHGDVLPIILNLKNKNKHREGGKKKSTKGRQRNPFPAGTSEKRVAATEGVVPPNARNLVSLMQSEDTHHSQVSLYALRETGVKYSC